MQVGHLVVANADYVIDSICRQLRHLDLNPHVPNVLAAMLSYIGVAHEILPLLEEPVGLFAVNHFSLPKYYLCWILITISRIHHPIHQCFKNFCFIVWGNLQMRLVSQELEIVDRQQHPNLTLPFLKVDSIF